MSFIVFQIPFESMQKLCEGSEMRSPFLYGMSSAFTIKDVRELLKSGDYQPVCYAHVNTLNEVFEASNRPIEEKLERIERMHSVSVGDVIVDAEADGAVWVVAPDGFDALGETLEQVYMS